MSIYFEGVGCAIVGNPNKETFKGFFQMKTAPEFALRSLHVVSEPLKLLALSPIALLFAGLQTLVAIKELFFGGDAKTPIKEAGQALLLSPIFLITALLSPLLNLIDILGSAINMLLPKSASSEVSRSNLDLSQNQF